MSDRLRPLLAILVLGAFSQVAQAVLIREGLVVFYGNEISLGAFYGSWLFWLGLGSLAALRLDPAGGSGAAAVRAILLALPPVLGLQVLALRSVRLALDVSSGEFVPLGDLFLAMGLVTLPTGVLLGLAFPLTCKALGEATGPGGRVLGLVAGTYVADALGALLGGAVFTFVLIRWFGPIQTLGLVTLALALTAAVLGPPGRRRLAWLPWPLALIGLTLILPPLAARLDRALEAWRFASLQPGMALMDAVDTRYGHVAVARLGDQTSVVADGQVQQSFPLPLEVERQAAYFTAQVPSARRVLVLGGYPGGLAAGLLRYPLERLDQVEQDRLAFDRIRPFLDATDLRALDDPRLSLHFGDGRRFLRHLGGQDRYDLILSLDATPASAAGNRYFTREAFALVQDHLTPTGVFCTQVSGASNYVGSAVGGYAGSVYRTLGEVFPKVVLVPGDVQTFCAGGPGAALSEDPQELQRRYLAWPLAEQAGGRSSAAVPDAALTPPSLESCAPGMSAIPGCHSLPSGSFATLLPREEVAFLRGQFEQGRAEINRDTRPVTYWLNMVLWGKFSGSGLVEALERLHRIGSDLGPWPFLIPPALFVLLWLLRAALEGRAGPRFDRQAGAFALFALGFIAMAGQLSLIYGYQAQVGLVFERIALLNGSFMTGLALGAGAAQGLARGLAGRLSDRGAAVPPALVLVLVGLGLVALPEVLVGLATLGEGAQEAAYLGLTLTLGLLGGAGFTLCLPLTRGVTALGSGALVQAADNFGGALGGLLTGALLVPILGVDGTCGALAALAVLALLPLLFAGLARPGPAAAGPGRGQASFPWPRLGWGLIYVVLLVYAWHLLDLGSRPGPELRFDEARLTEVSGSKRFTLVEQPLVHYLGFDPGELEASTLTLASAAARPGVSGFAGPIELLVAVGRDGVLRGVRYLGSRETPSYIAGIDAWVAGLAGRDLTQGPLSLERFDGLSGATVSSRAVLETVNVAAQRGTAAAFHRPLPPETEAGPGAPDWGLYATLVLVLLFFPVYLSGHEGARLLYQVAALGVLGLWLNTLVTEVDLVNLSQGQAASPEENPQRWALLGFVGVSSLLFGQVWCGYLCPFGAAQELVSRLGRRLGLRAYPERHLEQRARALKFVLLAAMLVAVWVTGQGAWATFNPMQHAFAGRLGGWMPWLTGLVLAACLFHYRFWCRYLCPMGAFLALGNKFALLQRLAPKRRFEHCDLGVKGEFDLDCIRCNRCLSGTDTHVRRVPARSAKLIP